MLDNISAFISECEKECAPAFARFEQTELINTRRVLDAFRQHRISLRHFAPTTGYGYDDLGRDTLGKIFADCLGKENAIVRPQITCGTHALSLCLYGLLRPGDTLLSAAGTPYDTLGDVIGLTGKKGNGSLKDFGIGYREAKLKDGKPDPNAILSQLDDSVKLILIQRSRGYDWRASLSVEQIDKLIDLIHKRKHDVWIMVDNCYGEFTDTKEPDADIMAGSLIKNPGGGLAPTGGYIAGKKELVEKVAFRLTSPGLGAEVGSYAGSYRPFYQGLFMAPHTVCQAMKTGCLFARAFEKLGYPVHPSYRDERNDIIQAIRFGTPERLIRFIQSIQMFSPVDSEAIPEPWDMPGYQDQVIMAAGSFVAGASIELSADAPIREPYAAYMQGGLSYMHSRIVLEEVLKGQN